MDNPTGNLCPICFHQYTSDEGHECKISPPPDFDENPVSPDSMEGE